MRRAILSLALAFAPMSAQSPLPADAPIHAAPGGALLGTLKRGTPVRSGTSSNGWTSIVIEGWIASTRVGTRKDSLDRTVTGSGAAALRVADGPQQTVIAEVDPGTLFRRIADRNGWTQVRRTVWVRNSALRATTQASAAAAPPRREAAPPASVSTALARNDPPPQSPPAVEPTGPSAQRTTRATALRASPTGPERATLRAGTAIEALGRDNGWVRVRIEGWVPERDLMTADSAAAVTVSAADIRADPAGYRGKIVRWDVQVISLQRADVLRTALAPDEPYLLARGPSDEGAILYIAIPPKLVDEVRGIPQLSTITISARVRDGRSAPVGAPLLDLLSYSK